MPTMTWKSTKTALTEGALRMVSRGARGILINNHEQTASQIREQVEALAPYVEFVAYGDLAERLQSSRRRGKPFCLLTFDDGKAVNARETAPELLRLGVPAVFYLTTGLVGTERLFWADRLAALQRVAGGRSLPGRDQFKAVSWMEREQRINDLCVSLGADADASDASGRFMSWEDARRMQMDGFEMGSHTVDHVILPLETQEEAARQIAESKQMMDQNGLRCRSFAFPNGNATPPLVQAALDAGMESTVTTAPVWLRRRDRFECLPRLYLKERADSFHIQVKALAARTGFALKNPNGEGRRYLFHP